MLSLTNRIAFLLFTLVAGGFGLAGFARVYARVRRGRPDTDARFDRPFARLWYATRTMLTQSRTFRKRPWISFFHSFVFYGFMFYVLVNLIDAIGGFYPVELPSSNPVFATYNLLADVLSFLVLVGVIALVVRRFALPARRDFRFNERTLLQPKVKLGKITRDSIIVSSFILFHVGSRAIGSAADTKILGPDRFKPFATALSHLVPAAHAHALQVFGYWCALGSVIAFLSYFPYTKHIHIFTAPIKYFFGRESNSGRLPDVKLDLTGESEEELQVGANKLEEYAWPRLLDAYACIQCNRCQDVCPASATGKSLSPSAIEINKRMLLNGPAPFGLNDGDPTGGATLAPGQGGGSLLQAILSPEALWACTTCGACMQVCPVQDEPMLDIIDIRRQQVTMEGEFPAQLQSAFRGMERAKNPWGINPEQRLAWADGLDVKTTDQNPDADVLYWVGCAASYDPQAQKTARAFVQLMQMADVNFAVLGKKECCTGDTARRSGNELLYQQLATGNVATLNTLKPKQIVTACPHCLNSLGNEYSQLGGNYDVLHHTQFLDSLMGAGKLPQPTGDAAAGQLSYHDPCYLGRHNDIYDAPRNVLKVLGQDLVELDRTRENSFCCGAGGAQFWKEEEEGDERISDNRYKEAQRKLPSGDGVLAVGCPFCKSMLESTPGKNAGANVQVRDVAELLLERLRPTPVLLAEPVMAAPQTLTAQASSSVAVLDPVAVMPAVAAPTLLADVSEVLPAEAAPTRKKWAAAKPSASAPDPAPAAARDQAPAPGTASEAAVSSEPIVPARKKWSAAVKTSVTTESNVTSAAEPAASLAQPIQVQPVPESPEASAPAAPVRAKWQPRSAPMPDVAAKADPVLPQAAAELSPEAAAPVRKQWKPKSQQ